MRILKFYNRFMKKVLIQSDLDNKKYINPFTDVDVRVISTRYPGLRQIWSLVGPDEKGMYLIVSVFDKYLSAGPNGLT